MDSQDQGESQSTLEQPQTVEPSTTEQPTGSEQVETVEVNGEQVSLDELKNGYMRTADYTRKTQELSKTKKELEGEKNKYVRNASPEQVEIPEDVAQAAEVLKQAGFVTKDELAIEQQRQADERKLQALIDANPDLASKEEAIRAIGKTDNGAWEDIIAKYGFKESNQILKAKARGTKGEPTSKEPVKQKSISQMTPEEYAEWKSQNLKGQRF
jgi:hypothetical protein